MDSLIIKQRPRVVRRWAVLIVLGWLAAAAIFTAGVARADGVLQPTEAVYVAMYGASAICPVIAEFPSTAGVLGVAAGIREDGFAADSAVDIINAAVAQECPQLFPLLQAIGAEARGSARVAVR